MIYFLIWPSTEYFPGPAKNRKMKISRNNKGFSFEPKGSSACAIKAATDMVIISGINESLLIKPTSNKMAQKNSAKMVSCRDKAGPKPIGSLNLVKLVLKFASFGQPCVNISRAAPTLKIANEMS